MHLRCLKGKNILAVGIAHGKRIFINGGANEKLLEQKALWRRNCRMVDNVVMR